MPGSVPHAYWFVRLEVSPLFINQPINQQMPPESEDAILPAMIFVLTDLIEAFQQRFSLQRLNTTSRPPRMKCSQECIHDNVTRSPNVCLQRIQEVLPQDIPCPSTGIIL